MNNNRIPEKNKKSFNCPHCNAYSQQVWINKELIKREGIYSIENISESKIVRMDQEHNITKIHLGNISVAVCQACERPSIWCNSQMVYPTISSAPLAHEDMPKEVKEIFNEARNIYLNSPRAAAALLRLATEHLCNYLGYKDTTIDKCIQEMIADGLNKRLEKSFDSLRIIGNNAVHPGKIDLNEDNNLVLHLFDLLNLIVKEMITTPNEIDKIYNMVPSENKKHIEKRNNTINKNSKNIN